MSVPDHHFQYSWKGSSTTVWGVCIGCTEYCSMSHTQIVTMRMPAVIKSYTPKSGRCDNFGPFLVQCSYFWLSASIRFKNGSSTPKQTLSANGHKNLTIWDDIGRWRRSQASVYRDPKKQFRFSMLFLTGLPLVYWYTYYQKNHFIKRQVQYQYATTEKN